jgi:hypothetical protein
MSFPELLEAVRKLPAAEKLRLTHELVDQVARSNESESSPTPMFPRGAEIISPIPAPEAAAALMGLLAEARRQ